MTKVKLFGLQRTCTNLVLSLLKKNFVIQDLEAKGEWKHGYILPEHYSGWDVVILLCAKNPYAWLPSCFAWFQLGIDRMNDYDGCSFDNFITKQSYGFKTPIHRYNEMYRHWLGTNNRYILFRHEDLLSEEKQYECLDSISVLERKRSLLFTESGRINFDQINVGKMDFDYYRNKEYMKRYTPKQIQFINGILDKEIMGMLGYEVENA